MWTGNASTSSGIVPRVSFHALHRPEPGRFAGGASNGACFNAEALAGGGESNERSMSSFSEGRRGGRVGDAGTGTTAAGGGSEAADADATTTSEGAEGMGGGEAIRIADGLVDGCIVGGGEVLGTAEATSAGAVADGRAAKCAAMATRRTVAAAPTAIVHCWRVSRIPPESHGLSRVTPFEVVTAGSSAVLEAETRGFSAEAVTGGGVDDRADGGTGVTRAGFGEAMSGAPDARGVSDCRGGGSESCSSDSRKTVSGSSSE
jgi:hypothetical protein